MLYPKSVCHMKSYPPDCFKEWRVAKLFSFFFYYIWQLRIIFRKIFEEAFKLCMVAFQHSKPAPIHDCTLMVHNIVVFQSVLARVKVEALYFCLSIFKRASYELVVYRLVFWNSK